MFTLTSYLKKVQEESARVLRDADTIRFEKVRLARLVIEKVEKRFFQDPEQIKQLHDFIKNKEIPFVENARNSVRDLIKKEHKLIGLLEKSAKKDLIPDGKWLWTLFKKIKPELINLHSWIRKEENALRKEDFRQFVKFYELEQAAYSRVDQTGKYSRIATDIYKKNKDDNVLLLSRIGGSALKKVAAVILVALSCVTAQAAAYTKPDEMNVAAKGGDKTSQESLSSFIEFREGFTETEINKAIKVLERIVGKCGQFKYHIVFTKNVQFRGEASAEPIYNEKGLWGFRINISYHLENEQLTDEEKYEFAVAHEVWHCIQEYTDTGILDKELFLLDSPFYKNVDLFKELEKFKKGEVPYGFVSFYAKFGYVTWLMQSRHPSYYAPHQPKPSIKNVVKEDEAETFAYLVLGHNYANRDPVVKKKLDVFEKFLNSIKQ